MKYHEITLLPYDYNYPGESQLIFVDKDNKSPDPSKLMLWGRDINGEMIRGNYKRYFERVGQPIHIRVPMEKRSTALQEQKDRSHIIKEYIRSLGLTRKSERKVPSKSKSRRGVKIHARVYGEHGLYGKGEQEITIIEREFAGTYGKIKGGPYVVKMGSTWYIGSNER